MTSLATMKSLCKAYKNTGRLAFIYARKRRVSLNGGQSMPFEIVAAHIREFLNTEEKRT